MNTIFRRTAAGVIAGAALAAAMPLANCTAEAADARIVVIGDSISSGKALEDTAKSYVALTGSHYQVEVVNLAKDTCTTEDLLTVLDDASVQEQLAQATVIFFTAGMQDMMNPFTEELTSFKEKYGLEQGTVQDLFTLPREALALTDDELLTEANVLASLLRVNKETCAANILKIGEKLSTYSNAKVVCYNVYNPLSLIEQFDTLSMNRQTAYNAIKNPAKSVLVKNVNPAYEQLAANYGFTVIDVYSQFDTLAYKYTGLNTMNFEPNALGHQWMSEQAIAALKGVLPNPSSDPDAGTLGDVDNNGIINAQDATRVLVAAAKAGTNGTTGLTTEQETAADVNQDGLVNATDATVILRYAAAVGNGQAPKISDFV